MSSKKIPVKYRVGDVLGDAVLPVAIIGLVFLLVNGGDRSMTLLKKERIIADYHRPGTTKKEKMKLFWALFLKNIKGYNFVASQVFLFIVFFLSEYSKVYNSLTYNDPPHSKVKRLVALLLVDTTAALTVVFLLKVLVTSAEIRAGVETLPTLRAEAFRKGMSREEAARLSKDELIAFVHGDIKLNASQRKALKSKSSNKKV